MTNTNGSSDRLDRIEQLLEQSIIESNARFTRIEQSRLRQDRYTERSNQRLDRLEQIAQSTLSIAQRNREDIERTEQLSRRNVAAIAKNCCILL